jgi:hypothetical protein
MKCIAGGGARLLCLYERASVRSPGEARRLLVEGCAEARDEEVAFLCLRAEAPAALSHVLARAELDRGRVVVSCTDDDERAACEQLAWEHGFSTFDGRRTCAFLPLPERGMLLRVLSLVRDPSVGRIEFADAHSALCVYPPHDAPRVRVRARGGEPMREPAQHGRHTGMATRSTGEALELLMRAFSLDRAAPALRVRAWRSMPVLVCADAAETQATARPR